MLYSIRQNITEQRRLYSRKGEKWRLVVKSESRQLLTKYVDVILTVQ